MPNNKKDEKLDIQEETASFLDINPKEMKRSLISNIKKQLILFPISPFTTDIVLSYKIIYDFLTSNPNKKAVWFSIDKPVNKVIKEFKDNGFDIQDHSERIIFIDAISKSITDSKNNKNFTVNFIENPDNLVEISMALQDIFSDQAIEIAVIDSLNGLLAFNSEKNMLKFMRFLSTIAEETDTAIISVFYKDEYPKELESAFQIPCDGLLQVSDDKIVLKKKLETITI
ncbi:MAG: ATPase domain-containing protein [Candidatus Micrarchaeia archaeon]